jgi:hypothetical protein
LVILSCSFKAVISGTNQHLITTFRHSCHPGADAGEEPYSPGSGQLAIHDPEEEQREDLDTRLVRMMQGDAPIFLMDLASGHDQCNNVKPDGICTEVDKKTAINIGDKKIQENSSCEEDEVIMKEVIYGGSMCLMSQRRKNLALRAELKTRLKAAGSSKQSLNGGKLALVRDLVVKAVRKEVREGLVERLMEDILSRILQEEGLP